MNDKEELKKLKEDLANLKSDIEEKDKEVQEKDKEIQDLGSEVEEYHSQLLRLQADFDNYKKRSEKDIKEFIKYANEKLLLKIIDAYEDLERALKTKDSHDLKEGVEMIHKKLKDLLESEGICEIEAGGEKFDHNKHDAIMVEDSDDYPDDTVIEELVKGYTLDSKVIKYSKVKVCKKK
jgi:molecular chaperone GrpE